MRKDYQEQSPRVGPGQCRMYGQRPGAGTADGVCLQPTRPASLVAALGRAGIPHAGKRPIGPRRDREHAAGRARPGHGLPWIIDVFETYDELRLWLGEEGQMVAAVCFGYADESPAPPGAPDRGRSGTLALSIAEN